MIRRLWTSKTARQLLGKSGHQLYIRVVREPDLEEEEEKIHAAGFRDGLHGAVTKIGLIGMQKLFDRFRQLWQVEGGFRVTKHDQRLRPVFCWNDRRIRVRIAIPFVDPKPACAILSGGWRFRSGPFCCASFARRDDRRCSVLHDPEAGRRHVIPSIPHVEAMVIPADLGLDTPVCLYTLNTGGKEMKSDRARCIRRHQMTHLIKIENP